MYYIMEAFLIKKKKKICDSDLKELICKKKTKKNMQIGIKQHDSNTDCLMIQDLFNTDQRQTIYKIVVVIHITYSLIAYL